LFQGDGQASSATPSGTPETPGGDPPAPPASPPGEPPVDPPASPPAPGCTPVTYYKDNDGDGVGGAQHQSACAAPGKQWVTRTGDCDDGDPDVNPDQKGYFPSPYSKPGGGFSFDYDCSDDEEQAPPERHLATDCTLVVGADGSACAGDGFIPQSGRFGPGVDPLCGDVKKQTCVLKVNGSPGCFAQITSAEPTSCR
jgi:hypothetical protein